jgi:AcrR family transcriptional regulator
MGRWQPNARERLFEAALVLYAERGFEQTTVAEIAKKAGLTERTFFRHFADKREVLFGGSHELEQALVRALDEAPAELSAIDTIGAAFEAITAQWPVRAEFSRRRQALIDANSELEERERIKMAALAAVLAAALRRRGVRDTAANLAAEMGIAVFRTAFAQWIATTNTRDFADLVRASLDELKAVSAGNERPA